jgi:TetR/AcrR family transcriptional regulator, transcriptional repressor of bet genes
MGHADSPAGRLRSDGHDFATRKGARQAERIVEAAFRCLAEYGYSGTSMQRIADEAGVNKRMLHYYFETRERLLEVVARRVGDRLLAQLEEAIAGLEEPADIVASGFDRVWGEIRADRKLQAVYFGLAAEAATDPALKRTLSYINDGYRELIQRLVGQARDHGWRLRWDDGSLAVLIIAAIQGLTLQFVERGETEDLERAIRDFKGWLVWIAERPIDGQTDG